MTAESAIARIRALHEPVDHGRVMPCCGGCEDNEAAADECCHEYPCPTIEIIEQETP